MIKLISIRKFWILFLVICLSFTVLTSVIASNLNKPNPAISSKVDAIFTEWNKLDSPGCSLAVIKDGAIIYKHGYGMANLKKHIPITSKTIFDIGSTSKQFTAASIVLLAQEGKISLDDNIRKYLPEIPDYGHKITIRNLIHHTSGLRDYLDLFSQEGIEQEDYTNDKDALDILIRQKSLNFKPGDKYLYCNSGYFLLSQIIKRASGQTLRQYAQEKIFNPLGMKNTHFHDDHTKTVENKATGYSPEKKGFVVDMSNFDQTGDGGVNTTVEDLFLWDQNFYHPKVGGKALIDQMLTRGKLNNGKKLEYAYGLEIMPYKGLNTVSHGGAWAGYRAELLRFPDQKFSVICLCNLSSMEPEELAVNVADIYLGDLLEDDDENDESF